MKAAWFRPPDRHRPRLIKAGLAKAGAAPLVLLAAVTGCTTASSSSAPSSPAAPSPASTASVAPPPQPSQLCGSAALNSPFSYHGQAGKFASGTAGLPTYGKPGTDFPQATAGVVLPAGRHSYASYQLNADTVYYLLPGQHVGSIQARPGDAFVGGFADGTRSVLSGEYSESTAIDSNFSDGNQPGVTIEYLTVQNFKAQGDGAAINQDANTDWTFRYNTITRNAPGAGIIAGAGNTLEHNCLTLNGQYGFQSSAVNSWGRDQVTGGPYDVTVRDNEISYNDTCDFEGLLTNPAIGWHDYNPVPERYRNPHCGKVTPNGNQGGFKLWETNGVTIRDNYIHGNWGPGAWVDTNNANTTFTGNTIVSNDGEAIIEEISYNFSITGNYMADNGWVAGLGNPKFPTPAIYVSQSGSDRMLGGVPACPQTTCPGQRSYPGESVISGNTFVNNGGHVLLWQNSDRFCSAGFDQACTLTGGGRSGPFTMSSCKSGLPSASVDPATYASRRTGSPARDWWNGCMWWTSNVRVTGNTIYFDPAKIAHCTAAAWPDCGAGGIFAEYGIAAPYNRPGGWAILSQVTFFKNNTWSGNTYHGPSTFYAWNQGNGDNPVSWAEWTGNPAKGDKCSSAGTRQSGACTGPFGQDSGSSYDRNPASAPPEPALSPAPTS
jgi:parallel beta-helix repeat protein